jgi:UDP-N-acetylmuramoylalanine--D-glutamate ligase
MELGWSRFRGRTVAVTGSNGKSSVVKALAECLEAAGLRAVPCGNYGLPVCQAVMDAPDWLVIEVSSFQLETCAEFRPDIGVLMNLLPNHLDRHGTLEAYARMKARLFARQREGDVALTPPEWRERFQAWSGGRGRWQTFGAGAEVDFSYGAGRLAEPGGGGIGLDGSYFNNEVLGPNAAALFGAALAAGVSPATVQAALRDFAPLPHRAQPVGEFAGVRYVDDSKATNLSAMVASIRMQDRPVWLIAGGRPKETDFSGAVPVLRERVRGVFLIGEAAEAMAAAWGGAVPCERSGTLDRAVAAARGAARPGDVVLLAPACTSYDQFRAYAERGEAFRKLASEKD